MKQRDLDTSIKGSDDHKKVIVECVGVSMGLQIPLLIIDPRGVSIMSALFTNRRVTHLRDTDIQLEQKFHAKRMNKRRNLFH